MDENEIYGILGITPPDSSEAPAGADKEQGPAEPSGEGSDSENVSDLDTTDDGGAEDDPAREEDQGQDTHPDGTGEPSKRPSAAQTARGPSLPPAASTTGPSAADPAADWRAMAQQMAARAVEEERTRNKAQWDAFFASAGLKNSLEGGKPITSLEEFQAWKSRYDRLKLEQDLKEGKLTPEAFEAAIRAEVEKAAEAMSVGRDDPALRSGNAQEITGGAPRSSYPTDRATTTPGPQVTQEQIDVELAEIHRLDGSVNGLEDILKLETGGAFQEAVRRGHSFLDAFKLANFDQLQSRAQNEAAQRAAQAARNSARSKAHLRSSDSKGGGSVAVPGDVLEMYRMMMPDKSEAEITAHYNRMLKEMKQ